LLVPPLAAGILIERYGWRGCWPWALGGLLVAAAAAMVLT
jgi:hypothetical protein